MREPRFSVISEKDAWSRCLCRLPDPRQRDIYFEYDYVNLYRGSDGRAEMFSFEEDGEIFLFPYILRTIDNPANSNRRLDFETAYGYGGPLSSTADRQFLESAWRAFSDHCARTNIIAGLVRFHPLLENHHFAAGDCLTVFHDRETVVLSLDKSPETVWAQYEPNTRNRIRKAQREGVSVSPCDDSDAVDTFGRIYHEHMSEIAASDQYMFGHDYFRAIGALRPDQYRTYFAKLRGEIIGGTLILLSNSYVHYHLSSSLNRYRSLAPNNILRHEVSLQFLGGTRRKLHFGGGRTPSPRDSLLRFKAGFSPERTTYMIGSFIPDKQLYDEICDDWRRNFPDRISDFGDHILKYRHK